VSVKSESTPALTSRLSLRANFPRSPSFFSEPAWAHDGELPCSRERGSESLTSARRGPEGRRISRSRRVRGPCFLDSASPPAYPYAPSDRARDGPASGSAPVSLN
jgi:hypothetical protein